MQNKPSKPLIPVLVLLLLPAVALATDSQWTKIEHDCNRLFAHPEKAKAEKLESCADTWSAHSRLHLASATDKSLAEKALKFLYDKGSDRGASIARDGLFRLGMRLPVRPPRGSEPAAAAAAAGEQKPRRKRYDPPEASRGDKKEAEKLAKAGVKDLVRKRYKAGTDKLKAATDKDPRSEFALYNLACGHALMKQTDPAVDELQKLADLGTDQSLERLVRARRDGDFQNVRDDKRFKQVTGYMRIEVINTIGEPGEPAIENIEVMLKKLGHAPPKVESNKEKRDAPQILFKDHVKSQVPLIAELLNHPRVRLDPMKEDSKYDMIIRWGAKVVKGDDGTKVESLGPNTVDDKIDAAKRKQNKALARPEQAIDKVDRVVGTPDRAYKGVEGMGKRVEGSAKKVEGSFKKIKGLGDKITSL